MIEYKDGYRNWWRVEIASEGCDPFTCVFAEESTQYRAWEYRVLREGVAVHSGTVEVEADRGKPSVQECLTDFMGHISKVCMGLAVTDAAKASKPEEGKQDEAKQG